MKSNKSAIVTGGTRGIGRAISLELARQGYRVWALYARNRAAASELEAAAAAAGLEIKTVKGDLSRADDLEAVVAHLGSQSDSFDALVHCAASGVHRAAPELSAKHLRWTFEINVVAAHSLLNAMLPKLRPGSRVVGITSAGGTRVIPYYAAVASSKGALEALFRHFAVDLAPRGIAVNLVCPGMVLTDAVEAFPDREARIEACLRETPTQRLTTAEDVADLVGFLCCAPAAGQIIGQTLNVDGGKCLKA
jgi:enoyl-[acyl-carrier protein] reductase III